jgi:hypothetical protein
MGGTLLSFTADNTRINFLPSSPFSLVELRDGSVAKNTIIEGGGFVNAADGLVLDATNTAENVTFEKGGRGGYAGIGLENPLSLTGTIRGLSVGDFIKFGGLQDSSPSIDVTSATVTNDKLTITYNNNQHATYDLSGMQPNTEFDLTQGTDQAGNHFSELTVVPKKNSVLLQYMAAFDSSPVHQGVTTPITDPAPPQLLTLPHHT